MNKYEMFDALNDYQNNLSHAQSKLYGSKQDNTKYYNRIGKPGEYRYFYTKAEWDAYQEGEARNKYEAEKKAKQETEKRNDMSGYNDWKDKEEAKKAIENINPWTTQDTINVIIDENVKKGINKLSEDIRKSSPEYAKNKAAGEAMQEAEIQKWKDLRALNNPALTVAQREAKEEAKKHDQWEAEQRLLKKQKEYSENFAKNAKDIEADRARNEEGINNRKEAKKKAEERKKIIKENTDYLLNDDNSRLNKSKDIIALMNNGKEVRKMIEDGTIYDVLYDQDETINDIYQEIAENKEIEETDPKTGFKIKNYKLSTKDEIALVNPGYYLSDQQYYSGLYGSATGPTGYANNCYLCTTAMALRKKGYDVNPGIDFDGVEYDYSNPRHKDPELGTRYEDLWTGSFTEINYYENTKSYINREPAGSYGDFNIDIRDNLGRQIIGHSIFYEVDSSGKVHYYDCQNGKEYSEKEMDNMINKAGRDSYGNKAYYTRYKRLDNQKFTGTDALKSRNKMSGANEGGILNEDK